MVNMKRLAILAVLGATVLGAQSFVAFADDVPTFDIQRTCNARVQAFHDSQGTDTLKACVGDEQNARATLVSQWTQFASGSKAECLRIQGDGAAPQSYVELLTCLQMAKQIKELPKD
jgi:hypothetical protein